MVAERGRSKVFFRHLSAFRAFLGFAAFDSSFRRGESGGIFIFRKSCQYLKKLFLLQLNTQQKITLFVVLAQGVFTTFSKSDIILLA